MNCPTCWSTIDAADMECPRCQNPVVLEAAPPSPVAPVAVAVSAPPPIPEPEPTQPAQKSSSTATIVTRSCGCIILLPLLFLVVIALLTMLGNRIKANNPELGNQNAMTQPAR